MRDSSAVEKMNNRAIAYFITPHGFGHATRAAAIMAAILAVDPTLRFEIFTRVPRWLFEQSVAAPFGYHEVMTDIGLAQQNAMHEDTAETVRRLDEFLPFDTALVDSLARQVSGLGCALLVCDIAPLGIAVAAAAGIPSVLVENFTWDWIYGGYVEREPRLKPHIDTLQRLFDSATYHIQTEPVCVYSRRDLLTTPVSRAPRLSRAEVRAKLGVPARASLALITMGGLSATDSHSFLGQLAAHPDTYFVIPGADTTALAGGNVLCLPDHSTLYHPDLMYAADVLVGKTGYSTVAEAYHAGAPYGYVSRPHFRESDVMAAYIQAHMRGIAFAEAEFHGGAWLARLPELLALGLIARNEPNGADQVARFLLPLAG
jgi:hypothetical protein